MLKGQTQEKTRTLLSPVKKFKIALRDWIFKRDWKSQASRPPNPSFYGVGGRGGKLKVKIEIFTRDWVFSIFGPLREVESLKAWWLHWGVIRRSGCPKTRGWTATFLSQVEGFSHGLRVSFKRADDKMDSPKNTVLDDRFSEWHSLCSFVLFALPQLDTSPSLLQRHWEGIPQSNPSRPTKLVHSKVAPESFKKT